MTIGEPAALRTVVSVVVADAQPLFRAALRRIFIEQHGFEWRGAAGAGEEALALIRSEDPDVAIIDVSLAQVDGIALARRIQSDRLRARVMFLTDLTAGDGILRAFDAGASGYVTKASSADDLHDAVRRVADGRSVISPALLDALASGLHDHAQRAPRLSSRELSILARLAAGESTAEIAAGLQVAIPTVKSHVQMLFAKLGVSDRAAAVAEAMRRGLIS